MYVQLPLLRSHIGNLYSICPPGYPGPFLQSCRQFLAWTDTRIYSLLGLVCAWSLWCNPQVCNWCTLLCHPSIVDKQSLPMYWSLKKTIHNGPPRIQIIDYYSLSQQASHFLPWVLVHAASSYLPSGLDKSCSRLPKALTKSR